MFPKEGFVGMVAMATLLCTPSVSGNDHSSQPKPCCWPSQMTGTIVTTTPDMHLFSTHYYADFDCGRSIDVAGVDSGLPMEFQFRDYNTGRRYLKLTDGTCKHYAMVDEYVQCMPDDSKLVNTLHVVEEGKERKILTWEFTAPNGGYQARVVYEDNCHPFIYRLEDFMVGYKFENVVARVDDNSVFDVDLSGCEKGD